MQYLPTTEEQNWLVARLADLIASRGVAQFTHMPIVEPTTEFFPDPWTFSHRGLDRLVRRLMQYADLSNLDIKIGTYVELGSSDSTRTLHRHRSTAGLFMGISEGRCLFAFNEQAPADAEYMAGVMCHEVAHAYRAHHGLVGSTSLEDEEFTTDVTATYLGFGILAANNSFRYRTAGWNVGALAYHSWSAQSTGYLPPQAFAFLLAIQMAARDLSSTERNRLLRQLEPDQAAFTKAALQAVWDRQHEITQALDLKPGAAGDAPKGPAEILQPLPEYSGPEQGTVANSGKETVRFNLGRPVFRVPVNRAGQYGPIGLIVGTVLGSIAAAFLRQPVIAVLGAILGVAVGLVRGYRRRFEICSDPDCEAILETAATVCPNCGGLIAGSIRRASDRLEAAEEWEQRVERQSGERPRARKIRRLAGEKDDDRWGKQVTR